MSKFTIQRIMLFYIMITLSLTAFSQQLTISGKITTTAGESLAGATVRIKALNRSTSTSVLGEYRFDGLAAGNYIVEVTVDFVVGIFKFRKNHDWGTNLGGANGILSAGGADIAVSQAGTYDIILDVTNNTYTLVKK